MSTASLQRSPHGAAAALGLALSLTTAAVPGARAEGWEFSGSVGVESRFFWEDAAFPGQLGDDGTGLQLSLELAPEWRWTSKSGNDLVVVSPFLRVDAEDDERSHFDLREAYWLHAGKDWEVTVGVRRVFWGVAESRHLVDVINQEDAVEDIDGEDRLGQPMISLSLLRDWGTLELYALPYFRDRTAPGRRGRLRPPLPVEPDDAIYESTAGKENVDLAVRWSHFIGDLDLGVHVFHGTEREARYVPSEDGNTLTPVHDRITQVGVDAQLTKGAWLWKLEAIHRERDGHSFTAAVAGFEWTKYGLGQSAADLGFLLEVHRDGRDPVRAPATIFESDVFGGLRLALNDTQDTSVLAGAIVDPDSGSVFGLIEAERRIGQHFKLELEARIFAGVANDEAARAFSEDDHLTLRWTWHM